MKLTLYFFLFISTAILAQHKNYRVSSTASFDPEEVTIAINTKNPNQLAAGANIRYFYGSSDSGLTWNQSDMTSTLGVWGDPCLIYDGLGNLFYAHLSNPPSPGYWIDRIVVQKSTDNGMTWNQGSGIGFNSPKNQDKEWLAVDLQDTPYKNFLYITWTEFDDYGSSNSLDSSRILFSRSTDNGITWSTPARVSDKGGNCVDGDLTVEGAVPTVGTNGEIYTAWSGPLGIMFDKSTDGGLTWGDDIFVSNQPGSWDFDIPGISRCNGLPITACDTSKTFTRGNIYILWGDQRNGTDNTDIFISKSIDGGQTWSQPLMVNNDNTTRHQFFPWLAIDQTTGHLFVVFYDRRNTTGVATDVYIAKSIDGGETFENFRISESSFTPSNKVFFGDYSNIAAFNRKVYPIWMRMDGSALSVWNAVIVDSSSIVHAELNNFTGFVDNNQVHLNWEINSESTIKLFEIERVSFSTEPVREWKTIGKLSAAKTTNKQSYSFIDLPINVGIYLYRIKQLHFDGSVNYSNEVEVNFQNIADFKLMQNYPNPFNPSTTISYQLPVTAQVTIKVFDVLGNEIAELLNDVKQSGLHEITFDASAIEGGLPSGLYFYRMFTKDKVLTSKMTLLK
ncbi:MAG: exo-alpha-sialidase [Ignavibacteriaceae bacterium]|nr:exo-alpha-sialidase [Ignavibacteriaceae bacterium]